ncbi:MAG: DUF2452 domain-containing protein [Polyangiales bacterium]
MAEGFKRYDGPKHEGAASTSPYAVSRLGAVIDLVDSAREIAAADVVIGAVASDKLAQIAEQIRALQLQAREVLERASRDAALHRARCNFQKVVGQHYHLYARRSADGVEHYFSMLSPEDWRGSPPHEYAGSFRLEPDQSWTPAEEVPSRDAMRSRARLLEG